MFTVTDGGFAKRTHGRRSTAQQGRGGLGIKAMKLNEDRGSLVGGLVVTDNDEVIAIKASGQITRSAVTEVPVKGRDTMGVKFVGVRENDSVVVIALNPGDNCRREQNSTKPRRLRRSRTVSRIRRGPDADPTDDVSPAVGEVGEDDSE